MTSRKNKTEILSPNKSKYKKNAKINEERCFTRASGSNTEIENCTSKDEKTGKKFLTSLSRQTSSGKRKASENGISRNTKVLRIASKNNLESDVISSSLLDDQILDSSLINNISETESLSFDGYYPLSNNIKTISEPCNGDVLLVPNSKLYHSPITFKPTQPVSGVHNSKSPPFNVSVISTESNLDIEGNNMPYPTFPYESGLNETEIINMIPECSTSFEKVNPDVIESADASECFSSNSFLQDSFQHNDKQSVIGSSVDHNNSNSSSYDDLVTLVTNRINEVKDSKENFICKYLGMERIISHREFNYNDNNIFDLAFDISTLRAANDYYLKGFSPSSNDVPLASSDMTLENPDIHDITQIVNFITGESNELNSESAVCINNRNSNDIQPNFSDLACLESTKEVEETNLDDCGKNLNNIENFIQSQDKSICLKETSYKKGKKTNSVRVDVLNKNNENSVKFCAKVKRKRKKNNWSYTKRRCKKRINKVSDLLNENLCDTCDESEVGEDMDIVPSIVTDNNFSEKHDTCKGKGQRLTCHMIKPKSKDNKKNAEDTISQILDEKVGLFNKCDEKGQFFSDQAENYPENCMETGACNTLSSSLSSPACDTSFSIQNFMNPELTIERTDYSEANKEKEGTEKCIESLNSLECKIKLRDLYVGVKKLDMSIFNMYNPKCDIENERDEFNVPSIQYESNQVINVSSSELSYPNSEDTLVPFKALQKELPLDASKAVNQKESLKRNPSSFKKSKPVHKSKNEESLSSDVVIGKHPKSNLKTTPKKLNVSEINKLPGENLKSAELLNTTITISGSKSNNNADKQDTMCSKIKEKSTPPSKRSKKNSKTIDSTCKSILVLLNKRKKTLPKLKITNLKLGDEKKKCSENAELHREKYLQDNSLEDKTASPERQLDISHKKDLASLKSCNNDSVTSDMTSNTHQENNTTSNMPVSDIIKQTDILSRKKTSIFDNKVVKQNIKCKNKSDSFKKSKKDVTKSSSKKIVNKSKVKVSLKQVPKSPRSLHDSMFLTDTGKKESNDHKIKYVDKSEQNALKESVNKLNSKIILPENGNSNSVFQSIHEETFNNSNVLLLNAGCNLNNENNCNDKIGSMKSVSNLAHKTKTAPCKNLTVELTIDNSTDVPCQPPQISDAENFADDTMSLILMSNTSEGLNLLDDDLDFEPDQLDDSAGVSMSNSKTEFLLNVTNGGDNISEKVSDLTSLETPQSEVSDSVSSFVLEHNAIEEFESTLQTKHLTSPTGPYNVIDEVSEEDTDSDDDHSFKRPRYERKDNDSNKATNSINLNNCAENNSGRQNVIHQNESVERATDEIFREPVSSFNSSFATESFKSSNEDACEDQNICSWKNDQMKCLKSKNSNGSGAHLNDILAQIENLCSKQLFNEALDLTNTYFAISARDSQIAILKKLLISIFSFISICDQNNNSAFNIFDNILLKLKSDVEFNRQLASYFITKCCSYPILINYSIELVHKCLEDKIPLDSNAVKAFSLVLESEEITPIICPLHKLRIDFMNYMKLICNKKISKGLVHLTLKNCEALSFPDIHQTCFLLRDIAPKEVEKQNLKEFILLCFKKDMWQYVAEMFISWGSKNCLSISIYSAFTADYKTAGKYFKKFANYVHEKEGSLCPELKSKLTPELKSIFGQMGTALMLDIFSRSDMVAALDILYTLHTYNVNYFELQLAMGNSLLTQSYSEVESYNAKTFPFIVVFSAIDICIHLNRPKDAFTIFQDFYWIEPDETLDDAIKTFAIKGKCERLLKLVSLLNSEDSLYEGWEALENLLTTVKQELAYESLQEKSHDFTSIYNKYLVSLINAEKMSSINILYQYSLGPLKEILTISDDVLRGLIVTFFEAGEDKVANSLFLLGVMKKIYPIQKPKLEHLLQLEHPWEITISTHWTVAEIKIVFEWFIGVIVSLLMEKPKDTNFEKWFSLRIVFNITPQSAGDLNCLKETFSDSKYYITKTKAALQNMSPSLEVIDIVKENALCIKYNSLYNFWKSRRPNETSKVNNLDNNFLKLHDRRFFGSDGICSRKRESSIFVEKSLSEIENLEKSPNRMQELQNKAETLQPLSPSEWQKPSKTDVIKMIDEIKSNSSSSYINIAHEQSSSGRNLDHISQSENVWFPGQIIDYQHQSPITSENQLIEGEFINCISTNQQSAISDINQYIQKCETMNIVDHCQSPLISNSRVSLPSNNAKVSLSPSSNNSRVSLLPSPSNDFQSLNFETNNPVACSNKIVKVNALCNSSPSSCIKDDKILLKKGKKSPHGTSFHSPVINNKVLNPLNALSTIKSQKKKKVMERKNGIHLSKTGSKATSIVKTSVPGTQFIVSNKKSTLPVKSSLSKSKTTCVNKTPVKISKKVADTKSKTVNSSSKQFENFKISISQDDDRMVTSFNQNLPIENKKKKISFASSNIEKGSFTNSQENPCSVFQDEVYNLTHIQNLPVVTKTVQINESKFSSSISPNVKIINTTNPSGAKSSEISTNTSSQDSKSNQTKLKPRINRNMTSLSKNRCVTSDDNLLSHVPIASGSGSTFNSSEKISDLKQKSAVSEVSKKPLEIPISGNFSWSEEDIKKAIQFLKMKINSKKIVPHGKLESEAHSLLQAFIKNNKEETKLNKRTMKLLSDFADVHV